MKSRREIENDEDIDLLDFLAEREERKLVQAATKLSEKAFEKVWDNDEDSVYDEVICRI